MKDSTMAATANGTYAMTPLDIKAKNDKGIAKSNVREKSAYINK
jgi:hypothetical protein